MDDVQLSRLTLAQFVDAAKAYTRCAADLPCGPRPLFQVGSGASILIIGQAPGRRTHESGKPWADASGQRLRDWLGIELERFYDAQAVALIPMGLCYPGTGKGGDLPPRPECAPLWHDALLRRLPNIRLTVLIGRYAIDQYAGNAYRTVTDAVRDYKVLLPKRIVLPHPSPRNNRWLAKNPWFEEDVLARLRQRVQHELSGL